MFYPQGNYHIDFKLDEESQYYLGGDSSTPEEDAKLKTGLERAACHLVFTIPYTEFEKVEISEVVRMVIDPTNNGRLFSLALKKGTEPNHLIVTKARVTIKEPPEESLIADKLKSTPLRVNTKDDSAPIIITFSLDEKSNEILDGIESSCMDEKEAINIRENIRRAFGQWVYENFSGLILGYTYTEKTEGALSDENEYEFKFTVIDKKRIIVYEAKIYERDPYRFQ